MFHIHFFIFSFFIITVVKAQGNEFYNDKLFDYELYERVLDRDVCNAQLQYMIVNNNNMAMLQFLDAGGRLPHGILRGSLQDWGNYHQCLAISHPMPDSTIEGKFCSIQVPVNQDFGLDDVEWPEWLPRPVSISNGTVEEILKADALNRKLLTMAGNTRSAASPALNSLAFTFGICIPKACSTQMVVNYLTFNQQLIHFNYTESYCRLPNDKPFSPGDYVGISIFSILGLLIIVSTLKDLHHTFILKKGPKEAHPLSNSFSVYTNARRLLTFNSSADTIECMDGIRAISMFWVIVGHTFSNSIVITSNMLDANDFMQSFSSFYIIAGTISVDTFFMLSGVLIVYVTTAKTSRSKFLKSLHLFYVGRYLRLFWLLASVVLLEATVMHHWADGPNWHETARHVDSCRKNWWVTLLYVQNYVDPGRICVDVTWYLAVDMQLQWISPILLVLILSSSRRTGWLTLSAALCAALVTGTTHSFVNNFKGSPVAPGSIEDQEDFMRNFYINTLTRASPFFVGMLFGYLLHVWRNRKVVLSRLAVFFLWLITIALSSVVIFSHQPLALETHDNQLLDNFANSFKRPLWAACLGWLIFACHHGYGGPVNWFLSLSLWKLPSRVSYGMYLLHTAIQYSLHGTYVSPLFFTAGARMYRSMADATFTFILSLVFSLAVDSPFSTVQKVLLFGNPRRGPPRSANRGIEAPKEMFENEAKTKL